MPYYLAPYIGAGTKADLFRPHGSDQPGWRAIDLRPDASRFDGGGLEVCVLFLPVHNPDPALRQLAGDRAEVVGTQTRNFLRTKLGISDLVSDRLDALMGRLLLRPPVGAWNRLMATGDRYEIWLDGLLWEEPVVLGMATDNFNRANETPLAGNWVRLTGGSQNANLVSNAVDSAAAGGDKFYYWNGAGAPATADQYSQAKQVTAPGAGEWGTACRIGSNGFSAYFTDCVDGSECLLKFVAGSVTLLGAQPIAGAAIANGDTLRVEAEGSTIRYISNGTTRESVTDTSLTTAGNGVGLFPYQSGGALDDWEGGDLAFLGPQFNLATEFERTLTTDPQTWTHTTTASPKGVVVAIVHGTSSTDHVSTVTYGGVALEEVVRAVDTTTEAGAAELWFLGSGIPTGNQTVSVDLASGTTDDIHFMCFTVVANANTEVIDFDLLQAENANPVVTLSKGGRLGWSVAAMYGGGSAPGGTLQSGNTLGPIFDLGVFYSQSCYETTTDASDHAIGWSTLGADDLAFVALCLAEITAVTYVPRHPGHDHANPAVF